MDRRTLFQRTALGSVLLVVGGSGFLASRRGPAFGDVPDGLLTFDASTFPIMVAVVETVLGAELEQATIVATRVDGALTFGNPAAAKDFKRLLLVLENAFTGVLLRGGATPFTSLSTDARAKALFAFRDSRSTTLRGGYLAMRKLSLASFYANTEDARACGYPGPPFQKPDPGPIVANAALSPPYVRKSAAPAATTTTTTGDDEPADAAKIDGGTP